MSNVKKNKSSVFILPMILGIPFEYFKGFINCYVGNIHDDDNEYRRIYVVFKTNDLVGEEKRITMLKSNNQFIREIIIDEFTLMIYAPLSVFYHDFDMFVDGKYSKFSDKYKILLRTIYPKTKEIHNILSPSNKDRELLFEKLGSKLPDDCEIYDSPYLEDEVFSISHFLEVDI